MAGGWTEWGKENIKGQGMIYRKLKNYARRKIQSLIDLRLPGYSQELNHRFAQNQQEIGTCRQELEQMDARNRNKLKNMHGNWINRIFYRVSDCYRNRADGQYAGCISKRTCRWTFGAVRK